MTKYDVLEKNINDLIAYYDKYNIRYGRFYINSLFDEKFKPTSVDDFYINNDPCIIFYDTILYVTNIDKKYYRFNYDEISRCVNFIKLSNVFC